MQGFRAVLPVQQDRAWALLFVCVQQKCAFLSRYILQVLCVEAFVGLRECVDTRLIVSAYVTAPFIKRIWDHAMIVWHTQARERLLLELSSQRMVWLSQPAMQPHLRQALQTHIRYTGEHHIIPGQAMPVLTYPRSVHVRLLLL